MCIHIYIYTHTHAAIVCVNQTRGMASKEVVLPSRSEGSVFFWIPSLLPRNRKAKTGLGLQHVLAPHPSAQGAIRNNGAVEAAWLKAFCFRARCAFHEPWSRRKVMSLRLTREGQQLLPTRKQHPLNLTFLLLLLMFHCEISSPEEECIPVEPVSSDKIMASYCGADLRAWRWHGR